MTMRTTRPSSRCVLGAVISCNLSQTSLAFLTIPPRLSPIVPIVATRGMAAASSSEMDAVELEVEEKFPLPADIAPLEAKLRKLGFAPKGGASISFVDIYYDLPSPHWYLTKKDCWLRYRGARRNNDIDTETGSGWEGKWQLKIRKRSSEGDDSAAVAYEEIQGEAALDRVTEILASASTDFVEDDVAEHDDAIVDAPVAPNELVPFAQFETTRSSWVMDEETAAISPSDYLGLSVDIDATDFGYGVGEVEALLNKSDDMADARKRIGRLVAEICAASDQTKSVPSDAVKLPTVGKLENYLMTKRPEHYDAIINAGIFKPV